MRPGPDGAADERENALAVEQDLGRSLVRVVAREGDHADGGTHATSGVVPELTRKLFDLTRGGSLDEAVKLQYRLLELFDAMVYSADFPEGFRAAVELRGFNMGQSRQPLSEDQLDSVDHIWRAGRHLLNLINDILDFARIEAGSLEVVIDDVDMQPMLKECVQLLGDPGILRRPGLGVRAGYNYSGSACNDILIAI